MTLNPFDEDPFGRSPQELDPFGQEQPEENDDGLGFFGTLGDAALGVPRGILGAFEGAANGLYGAADFLTGDNLLKDREFDFSILGESRSTLGLLSEGVVQFTAGFIPITRGLSTIGRFSKLRSLTRNAVAGAVTDFTVFQGHENRLSELIERFPGLEQPIAEALAGEESEIEGRLKNALQGLLLGGMIDGLTSVVKYIKAGQVGRASKAATRILEQTEAPKGASALEREAAEKAADEAAREAFVPQDIEDGLNKVNPQIDEIEKAVSGEVDPGLTPIDNPKLALEEVLNVTGQTNEQFTRDMLENVEIRRLMLEEDSLDVLGDAPSMSIGELVRAELTAKHLNLTKLQDKNVALIARGLEDTLVPFYQRQLKGLKGPKLQETFKKLQRDGSDILVELANGPASDVDGVMGAFMSDVQKDLNGMAKMLARSDASISLLNANGKVIHGIAEKLKKSGGNEKDWLLMHDHIAQQVAFTTAVKGYRNFFGKGLRFVGREIKGLSEKQAAEIMEGLGTPNARQDLIDKIVALGDGDIAKLNKAFQPTTAQALVKILNIAFVNALVSGGRTQTINFAGNTALSFFNPMERFIGAKINEFKGKPGAAAEARKAWSTVTGLSDGFRESVRYAKAVFDNGGQPILRKNLTKNEIGGLDADLVSSAFRGGKPLSTKGATMADWIGRNFIGLPTRVLQSIDEGFQQLTFRAEVRAELRESLHQAGHEGEGLERLVEDKLQRFLSDGMARDSKLISDNAIAEAQRGGLNNEKALKKIGEDAAHINDVALSAAGTATQTQPLRKGTVAKSVETFMRNHPLTRQFNPFLRTPANLIAFGAARTPLALGVDFVSFLRKRGNFGGGLEDSKLLMIQQFASPDARVQAEVAGRISTAVGFTAFLATMVSSGALTGRGPSNVDLRNTMRRSGWQPYSIRLGDKWVSYERFDPFATIFGISADMYTFGQYASSEHEDSFQQASGAFLTAVSSNLTNKTFLAGIGNIVKLFGDLEGQAPKFFGNHAATLFAPSLLNQANQATDPLLREARDTVDQFFKRIPGFSQTLEPVRDVFGESIHRQKQLFADETGGITNFFLPIATSTVSDTLIDKEFRTLGTAFEPPRERLGGVDLVSIRDSRGRTAYDRYQSLVGTVRRNGRTLKQEMRRVIKSREYQRALTVDIDGIESPKANLLKNLISRYRRTAQHQLEKQLPEVKRQLIQVERQRSDAARGINSVLFR